MQHTAQERAGPRASVSVQGGLHRLQHLHITHTHSLSACLSLLEADF